jgi:hypothetical protein
MILVCLFMTSVSAGFSSLHIVSPSGYSQILSPELDTSILQIS